MGLYFPHAERKEFGQASSDLVRIRLTDEFCKNYYYYCQLLAEIVQLKVSQCRQSV